MFRNILSIAFRNLTKHKAFSLLHICGLAIGMAAFVLIIHYVRFERSYEKFHTNAENIYRITLDFYNGADYVITDCETQSALGPLLKEKLPEVVDYVRIKRGGNRDVRVGDVKFYEDRIYYGDPSSFKVFSFHVLSGDNRKWLDSPFQAVLTSSMAKKYFGREDVAGESINISGDLYKITAVIEDLPANTHLKINFLLSNWEGYGEDAWNGNNDYTYIQVVPGTNLAAFNTKLLALCQTLKDKIAENRFVAEPILNIHLYSSGKTFEPEPNGSARTVSFLLVVAIFIIVIAWVNYINLSTARAVERAREVGIRKVMGSARSQLIAQFMSESLIVNLLSGALALLLVYFSLPIFRDITSLPLTFLFADGSFWLMFLFLILTGTLLAGFYPALVLSSFDPVTVLKGKFRSSAHGQWLRQGLVILQFGASVILLVSMATVYLQIRFLQDYDLGLRTDHTLVLRPPMVYDSIFNIKYKALENKLRQYPFVQKTTRSESLPGMDLHELGTRSNIFKLGDEKKERGYRYYIYGFDEDFISTFDMKLLAGHNFSGEPKHDPEVIINERAMHTLGFKNPEEAIGAKITFRRRQEGLPSTVIGVLKNFHQRSPKEAHLPMIFKHETVGGFTSVKFKTDNIHESMRQVKAAWIEVFPDFVFNYFFLDEEYNQQYNADRQFGQVVGIFSALAVFIACLGLFGLSSYTVTQRTKEIGIRKVLGASVPQIVKLLSGDFIKLIIVASLLALPIGYLAMKEWLSHYSSRIDLSGWIFVIPFIMILLITFVTVSFQTVKAALENPTQSLKYE